MKTRISCVFLGSSHANALYSFQMVSALLNREDCELQIVVSKRVYNLSQWEELKLSNRCSFHVIDTYGHSAIQVALSFFNILKIHKLARIILQYKPHSVYFPFGCVWGPVIYPILHRKVNIITSLHDPHPHDKAKNIAEFLFNKSANWAMKFVRGIIILNKSDQAYVIERYRKSVRVIPHAAFSYYARNLRKVQLIKLTHTILFVGRIEPYKGLDVLVDAFEQVKYKNIRLIIAGAGNIPKMTLKKIMNNSMIELRNRMIPDQEMINLVISSDFLVLPYKRASQSGVIPMAFALGRTVVSTNVGALSEQVPHGTGIIVEPFAHSVAEAIETFYDKPDMLMEYSENASKYANTELTWDKSAAAVVSFVKELSL